VTGWLILAAFVLLAVIGEPLFVSIGVVTVLCVGFVQNPAPSIQNSVDVLIEWFKMTDSPYPIAIPLFTLAGAIMTRGGISSRLVAFARAVTCCLPGGLGMACVVACTFFAALSGSSAVTIIAIGGILYPALIKDGFSDRFSLGLLTACGGIGILAPPSLPLIVFGIVSHADINQLFIAGILPGLLCIAAFLAWCGVKGVRLGVARSPWTTREVARTFWEGKWAVLLPVLLLGGIYSGLTTTIEASAVAVVYALVVEVWVHRELSWRELPKIALDTMVLVGSILIILLMAFSFTNFLTLEEVPQEAADWIRYDRVSYRDGGSIVGTITAEKPGEWIRISPKDPDEEAEEIPWAKVGSVRRHLVESRLGFLIAVNVLLLVVGCIMDIFSALVVFAPLIVPIAQQYGVDLVHLGIIFVVNLEIGFATPPFGINLFISSSYFKRPVTEVFRASAPWLLILLSMLAVITAFPDLSLWLVRLSGLR